MKLKHLWIIVVLCLVLAWIGHVAETENQAEAVENTEDQRILAIAVNEGADNNYDNAMATARRAGLASISLPQNWDDLETGPGRFSPNPNFLAIANMYHPRIGMKVALGINPLDTNHNRVPEYLRGKSFDHPEVIAAYKRLLDFVFSQIPDLDIVSLSIGNEIDGVLRSQEEWDQYSRFYAEVADYARQQRKGLKVGTKGMFHGMVNHASQALQTINRHSDVIMVTYYPLSPDFIVREPSDIHDDFAKLLKMYPEKPIYVMEIGYPSGETIGSSELKQAEFIQEAFKLWDEHADRIGLMQFTWLHDQSSSALDFYKEYYGSSHSGFVAFLATLGLRTHDNKDKLAFVQLIKEAKSRGWR